MFPAEAITGMVCSPFTWTHGTYARGSGVKGRERGVLFQRLVVLPPKVEDAVDIEQLQLHVRSRSLPSLLELGESPLDSFSSRPIGG